MKKNLNTLKRILLVLLVCITGYLFFSTVVSWTINRFQQPADSHNVESLSDSLQTERADFKFKPNDRAIFDFTGDTVLIIGAGMDYPYDEERYWEVQIVEPPKKITKMDLPEQFLIPITDSIAH